MKGLNELLRKSGVRREAKAEPQEMPSHSSAREVRQPEELGVGRVFLETGWSVLGSEQGGEVLL